MIGLVKMGLLPFEILPMLSEYRILEMGNTVEMAGGTLHTPIQMVILFRCPVFVLVVF